MYLLQNFYPQLNYAIAGTGASSTPQAIAQPAFSTNVGVQQLCDMRVVNATTDRAFIAWTLTGTATASAGGLNSVPMAAGATEVFRVGPAVSVAVILATSTSTGTVHVSFGEGT